VSLKKEIERELGIPIRLRVGAPGSLTVIVNGEKIYSKKDALLPPGEIIKLIREKSQ